MKLSLVEKLLLCLMVALNAGMAYIVYRLFAFNTELGNYLAWFFLFGTIAIDVAGTVAITVLKLKLNHQRRHGIDHL